MISLIHISCIFTGIFAYILFNVQIKKAYDTPFTCLSAYIWANILFCCSFFIKTFIETGSLVQSHALLGTLFTTNITLSLAASIIFLLMSIIFSYLLDNFPLSNVTMVLQLGVPIGSLGYFLVGNITTPQQFAGVIVITIGALISGFKKFTFPNIFKPLFSVSLTLYTLGIARSVISVMGKIVVFFSSQKTIESIDFHKAINTFDDFIPGTNTFESALDFIVGRSPFLIFIFSLYLLYKEKFSFKDITKKTKKDLYFIITGGILIGLYTALYYYVFQTIPHKSVLSALNKFKIPFTVIIASLLLKEKIDFPKKVAVLLIVAGGLLAAL